MKMTDARTKIGVEITHEVLIADSFFDGYFLKTSFKSIIR